MSHFTLIDSDILIDSALNVEVAIQCLENIERNSNPAVSTITQLELLIGCRNKNELHNTEKFLRRFRVLPLNEIISQSAVDLICQYRLSHGLLLPDALIAATSLVYDLPFITKNQRDYRFIKNLQLLNYPLSQFS